MNSIHKNVAILSRNVANSVLKDPGSSFSFLVEKNNDYAFDIGNTTWP